MNKELLAKVEILGSTLPPITLDKLIHDLGGPDRVAEVRSLSSFRCWFLNCQNFRRLDACSVEGPVARSMVSANH